uniref:Uncharacterized protein n=1 Tax=Aegilops tauschii subsp. strangulata TaxID=200361 RepID=A0A453GGF9_AEGTS
EGEPGVQAHGRHPRRYHLARAVQVDLLLPMRLHALARPHLPPRAPKEDAAVHRRLLPRSPATEKWVVVLPTNWSSEVVVARLGFDPSVPSHFHVFQFINDETLVYMRI